MDIVPALLDRKERWVEFFRGNFICYCGLTAMRGKGVQTRIFVFSLLYGTPAPSTETLHPESWPASIYRQLKESADSVGRLFDYIWVFKNWQRQPIQGFNIGEGWSTTLPSTLSRNQYAVQNRVKKLSCFVIVMVSSEIKYWISDKGFMHVMVISLNTVHYVGRGDPRFM